MKDERLGLLGLGNSAILDLYLGDLDPKLTAPRPEAKIS